MKNKVCLYLLFLCIYNLNIFSNTQLITQAQKELSKNPHKVELHEHFAKQLIEQETYDEALAVIDNALVQFGRLQSLLVLKALVHIKKEEVEKAAPLYLELYKRNPHNHLIAYNIGWCLSVLHQHEDAIKYYLKMLSHDSNHHSSHLGISKAYLAVGDYTNAWPHFEWRMANYHSYKSRIDVAKIKPEDFTDKHVHILAEWGLGDMMQFVRYVKEVRKMNPASITVQTFKSLVPLFSRCPYIDTVYAGNATPRITDIQIPMMSLAYVFKTTLETIPNDFPYLTADETLVKQWEPFFQKDDTVKIGLCWGAKKIFLEEHPYTRRSIPLNEFAVLADIPNVTFYSLQKVYDTDQLAHIPDYFHVHDFGPDFDETHGGFMDTAAVMEHLDLILSVDTSVIHLAGNLYKKPVWVLLPYSAAWWWLYERTSTPWYPTMRFFRQKRPKEWGHVFAELKKELTTFVQNKKGHKS